MSSEQDATLVGETPPKPEPVAVTVPILPTEAMWGGLARNIVMWLDFDRKTVKVLYRHLRACGVEIPDWLHKELDRANLDYVPSKGTRAAIIYRAMIEDFRNEQ